MPAPARMTAANLPGDSGGLRAGSRRTCSKSVAAVAGRIAREIMQTGTFPRLYDRKKFSNVRVRTASLSQLWRQSRQGDCSVNYGCRQPENCRQGRPPAKLDANT